ncbi:MAG: methylated-DNA--[protein]-cysteine S-methyltransferase [Verrucomicrobiota bacterium]
MNQSDIHRTYFDSPVGRLLLGASAKGLVGIYFDGVHRRQPADTEGWIDGSSRFGEVVTQLTEYFAGERRDFKVAIDWEHRGTPFFHEVWKELITVPYGETVSYLDLAGRIGRPKAVRAVAMANARNPISIIIPCHRVIGSNGKLTGYAGGMNVKKFLLDFEGPAGSGKAPIY